jgi:hypothetical protein
MRGKLKKATCGTRDAAQSRELEYTEMMVEAGFTQRLYSTCVFYHEEKKIRAGVYGDDFSAHGSRVELDWFREVFQRRLEVEFKRRLQ